MILNSHLDRRKLIQRISKLCSYESVLTFPLVFEFYARAGSLNIVDTDAAGTRALIERTFLVGANRPSSPYQLISEQKTYSVFFAMDYNLSFIG